MWAYLLGTVAKWPVGHWSHSPWARDHSCGSRQSVDLGPGWVARVPQQRSLGCPLHAGWMWAGMPRYFCKLRCFTVRSPLHNLQIAGPPKDFQAARKPFDTHSNHPLTIHGGPSTVSPRQLVICQQHLPQHRTTQRSFQCAHPSGASQLFFRWPRQATASPSTARQQSGCGTRLHRRALPCSRPALAAAATGVRAGVTLARELGGGRAGGRALGPSWPAPAPRLGAGWTPVSDQSALPPPAGGALHRSAAGPAHWCGGRRRPPRVPAAAFATRRAVPARGSLLGACARSHRGPHTDSPPPRPTLDASAALAPP